MGGENMSNKDVQQINFYCDESSHIKNDGCDVMTLAAVYCSKSRLNNIKKELRLIKEKHGIKPFIEVKWNKISDCNLGMYKEIIDYIGENTLIKIRIIIAKHKNSIENDSILYGSYDSWYSKMYYTLIKHPLEYITNYSDCQHIKFFIDKKDSNSYESNKKLEKYLNYSCPQELMMNVADSKEHVLIQVADILAGAAAFEYRDNTSSNAKKEICEYIQKKLKIDFKHSSRYKSWRANVFIWNGRDL